MNNIRYFDNLKRAVNCIEKNLRGKFSYPAVSVCAGMSKDNLWRVFKMLFNETPASYARKRKLSLIASRLLSTKKTINELCKESGWEMQSSFSRTFKQHYGISPEQYRKNNSKLVFLERNRMADSEIRHILSGGVSLKPVKVMVKPVRMISFSEELKLKSAVTAGIKLSYKMMTGVSGSSRSSREKIYTTANAYGAPLHSININTPIKIESGFQRKKGEYGGEKGLVKGGLYYKYRHSGPPGTVPASLWRIFCNNNLHKNIKHILIVSENRFNIGQGMTAEIYIPVK